MLVFSTGSRWIFGHMTSAMGLAQYLVGIAVSHDGQKVLQQNSEIEKDPGQFAIFSRSGRTS